MKKIVFSLNHEETLAQNVSARLPAELGITEVRRFPDGESYVRVLSDVGGMHAVIVCTLHQPNDKFIPLYFLCRTLKELGAFKITLVAPYLAYMRQDTRFKGGEAISSEYFAQLLSSFIDEIITVDPHLHRRDKMSEIYAIESNVLHTAGHIAQYIKNNIAMPLLIGPDSESEQWVSGVAQKAGAPFLILNKQRHGDERVEITVPDVKDYMDHVPVLVDDIISTAHTMMQAMAHLKRAGMKAPVCIGVHAVFARNAFEELKNSGAADIVTCNTISHPSNKIDISDLLVKALVHDK